MLTVNSVTVKDESFGLRDYDISEHFIPVTTAIADRRGHLNAVSPVSVIDGLMAATALEEDLTLVTRNVHDVARTGVKVLNPFDEPEG